MLDPEEIVPEELDEIKPQEIEEIDDWDDFGDHAHLF